MAPPRTGRVMRRGKGVDVEIVVSEDMLLAIVDEELRKRRLVDLGGIIVAL